MAEATGHLDAGALLAALRLLHREAGAHLRMMRLSELREAPRDLPVDLVVLAPSLAGLAVRFTMTRRVNS